nr:reverse transcriptase domain-containing protein [Tanacetum cinerariifolium]
MSTRSSARNLFPPLDNPELTIRRRSHSDPTLLNNSEMAAEGPGDLPSIKVNGVTDDALLLYLFPYSLTHHATAWFDRLPRNSINNFEQMAKMFLGRYFPPSMVTKVKKEIINFRQHTFYNSLTLRHCDTINATEGRTFMKRHPEECYDLIENMTAHHNDWDTSAQRSESSSSITSSSDTKIAALKAKMVKINKNLMRVLQVNQQVKAVTPNSETYGGPHSFSNCPATIGNTQNVYAAGAYQAYQASVYQALIHQPQIPQPQVVTTNEFANFMKVNDAILKNMQTDMTSLTNLNLELKNMFGQFMKMNTASSSGSGTLPGNTITNPKEDLKGITTRRGTTYPRPMVPTTSSSPVVERETEATKDTMHPTNNESTEDVQPLIVPTESLILTSEPVNSPIIEPIASPINLNFNIIFTDALILMPKSGPSIKSLLTNKDKLCELARTPLNEHCSVVLLKKLPEKLGDPGKFLIPCDFPRMAECLALADLGARINLMPLSMWNKLSLPDLSPTCMTLELADRLISRSVGVAEDVFVKVGTFHFPIDFVVVDFDADPRVPLILGRSFLKTGRALIDVFEANYNDMTANRIDVIDMACEEYSQEVLVFLTDFLLEEVNAFLAIKDDPTSSEVDQSYLDTEGDILLLEAFPNDDTSLPLPNQGNYLPEVCKELKIHKAKSEKSSIDEPSKVELKDLPPHLEYVSPVHCVPKKGGFTVVENEENELILTRLVMGWRVCINYRKLNEATRKDHFPLPFMDQMLERLAGNQYYCFLDGLSGYFQILIDPKDQEKTTFTCPYGTFAYRRMPFGLCNAPGMFKRFMMAIFHDMIKKTIEVFMDDFSVFRNSFQSCLSHLEKILKSSCAMLATLLLVKSWGNVKNNISRQYTMPVLLLQEFTFKVIDTKGAENLAADHLSRLENPHQNVLDPKEINESFRLETLNLVSTRGVYMARKPLTSSRLSTMDPPGDTMAQITQPIRFGTLRAIISDRGTYFCNDQFAKVMLKFGVTHRLAIPYHPQTSGQVEVSNRGLTCILERTVGKKRASWSDKLDDALWAFQTAYKTPIGCTPYKLVYGKAKVQLNELRDLAYENSLIYKEKTKRLHDSKSKDRVFNIGDRVLLFNSRLKIFSGKLKSRWSGPFTSSHVFPYGTIELSQPDRPTFKVNGHILKHYFREDVSKMVVPDLQTFPKDH